MGGRAVMEIEKDKGQQGTDWAEWLVVVCLTY